MNGVVVWSGWCWIDKKDNWFLYRGMFWKSSFIVLDMRRGLMERDRSSGNATFERYHVERELVLPSEIQPQYEKW